MEKVKLLFKNIDATMKRNKSIFYYISFMIIIIIFGFFFNSRSILPGDNEMFNTSIGTEVDVGSTKVVIRRWEYNEDKGFMEIELSYLEEDDSLGTKFRFSAKPEVNTQLNLPVKTVISTDDTYIIHIENVPKNYGAISLKVSQGTNINTSPSYVTSDDFSTASDGQDTDNDTSTVNLYSDYRKVKINNNLKGKTQSGYLMDITKTEIKISDSNIITIDKTIASNSNLVNMINKKIADLNGQLKYEIDSEQQKTISSINSYNSKIQQTNTANANLLTQKGTEQEKIKKLQQKLKDIANNK